MKAECWVIGKTSFPYLEEGISLYLKRLVHYLPVSFVVLPDIKNAGALSSSQLKEKEGESILQKLQSEDYLILLDERGNTLSSMELANFIQQKLSESRKKLVFLVGGAYGFSPQVYKRANYMLSLSRLTFSHQMVRLFLVEQLYRSMTILKGESYHNE